MANYLTQSVWLVLSLMLSAATDLHASVIQNSDNKLCAFSLEGPITNGDSDKLFAAISRSHIDQYDERTSSICLKSDGGSYVEGLKIAKLIYRRGLSTVIEYGSECYSACAIIFMAGVTPGKEIPMRKLSIGGVLGFHAPYLTMPDQKYSKGEVEAVAQAMRTAIFSLMQLSSIRTQLHGGDFIKKSLIAKILEKGPTEVFFVRTIYEAARWDILLYDAAQYMTKPSSIGGAKNSCANFHSSNMDEEIPSKVALSLKVEKYSSKFQRNGARVLVKNAKTNDTVCELYPRTFKNDDHVQLFACSYDYWSSKSFGDCREYLTAPAIRVGQMLPEFFSYDPAALLLHFKN